MTDSQKKVAGIAVVAVVLALAGFAYVRARNAAYARALEISRRNTCKNNLRMIDAAKDQAALAGNYTTGAAVAEQEISPYLKGGFSSLVCPKGGRYTIGPIGKESACSEHGDLSTASSVPMPAVSAAARKAADARSAAMEDAAVREAMRQDGVMAAQIAASQAKREADAEAARLERERQAKRAADAEAARLEQERQAELAAEAEGKRQEQERQAGPATPAAAPQPEVQVAPPPAAPVKAPAPAVPYKLSGIMGKKGNYIALIDNRIHKVGDRLGSGRIVSIEAAEVTIETAEGTLVKLKK